MDNRKERIRVESLKKVFGEAVVLEDVDLDLYDGEILVVLGRNGCGKSVLFKVIEALLYPEGGRVFIDGEDIHSLDGEDLDRVRKKIGFVFQKSGLFDSLTVGENVGFGLRRFTSMSEEEIDKAVTSRLAQVGLPGSETKKPAELSGGMQKRAGLARAIIQEPEIILYDDPTAGLDPVLTDAIASLILQMRSDLGVSSMVITHDLNLVEKIADRVCLLYKGVIRGPLSWPDFKNSDDPVIKQYVNAELEGPINFLE